MCLAIPGKVVSVDEVDAEMRMGRVQFGGITKEVSLQWVPDASVGDYVLVHIGFALQKIDEAEAQEVFRFLEENDHLEELGSVSPYAGK